MSELTAAEAAARQLQSGVSDDLRADGFAIAVEGWTGEPGYALALQSLDSSGAKLLSVTPATDASPERATVWLPYSAVERFFSKIESFATGQTTSGAPSNRKLVANIHELRLAVLQDLWQERDPFPERTEPRWWELWLVRLGTESDPGAVLRAVAGELGWQMVPELLSFPDNVIALVHTTANDLATILNTSATPRELHHARVTSEFIALEPSFQRELIEDLRSRTHPAPPSSAAVTVLDTGIRGEHPLLRASVDFAQSALEDDGPADRHGHGTEMAGLALFRWS